MYVYIQLEDTSNNNNYYAIRFKFIWINDFSDYYDPISNNFTANITDISETGLVKIKFSTELDIKVFNITKTEEYRYL